MLEQAGGGFRRAGFGKPVVGGSDSHTLAGAGAHIYGSPRRAQCGGVPGGHAARPERSHGESGDYLKLTPAVCASAGRWSATNLDGLRCWAACSRWRRSSLLANYFRELAFAWYWGQKNRPVDPEGGRSRSERWRYDTRTRKYTLSAPDYNLMRRFNRWRAPRWVRWWMLLATRAGDGWLWGSIGIAVLLSPDPRGFTPLKPPHARSPAAS